MRSKPVEVSDIAFLPSLQKWFSKEKGFSDRTVYEYLLEVVAYGEYAAAALKVSATVAIIKATVQTIGGYRDNLKARGLSAQTIRARKMNVLRYLYQFLIEQKLVSENPVDGVVSQKEVTPGITVYCQTLSTKRGLRPESVKQLRRHLGRFAASAAQQLQCSEADALASADSTVVERFLDQVVPRSNRASRRDQIASALRGFFDWQCEMGIREHHPLPSKKNKPTEPYLQAFEHFLEQMRYSRVSRRCMISDMRSFVDFAARYLVCDVRAALVLADSKVLEAFFDWLTEEGYSFGARKRKFMTLTIFYEWLVAYEPDVKTNSMNGVARPAEEQGPLQIVSDQAFICLISEGVGTDWIDERDRAVACFHRGLGLRVGEVVAARWCDLLCWETARFRGPLSHFRALSRIWTVEMATTLLTTSWQGLIDDPDSRPALMIQGNRLRVQELSPLSAIALDRYQRAIARVDFRSGEPQKQGPIFVSWCGKALGGNGVSTAIDSLRERSGIAEKVSARSLRNTFGLSLVQHGVKVGVLKRQMGYAKLAGAYRFAKCALGLVG